MKKTCVSQSMFSDNEGYILVSSPFPQHEYVLVEVYYCPYLTDTFTNEEDYLEITRRNVTIFLALLLRKFYSNEDGDINTWKYTITYCSGDPLCDIVITGI